MHQLSGAAGGGGRQAGLMASPEVGRPLMVIVLVIVPRLGQQGGDAADHVTGRDPDLQRPRVCYVCVFGDGS